MVSIDVSWSENIPIDDLTKDEMEIVALADEMASSMASLNSQTYDNFIQARDRFRKKIKQVCDKSKRSEERIKKLKEAVSSI